MRLAGVLDSVRADIVFGLRQCMKSPLVTTAIVLSLAIGIGANTAVFALLDAAILKPLPVRDPDRLVVLEWTNADGFPAFVEGISGASANAPGGGLSSSSVSAPLHRALAREAPGVEAIVGMSVAQEVSVASGSLSAESLDLQFVSANFFQALGVRPAIGRPFLETDDRPGAQPVVIVSHRYWLKQLGGSPDVSGRTLRVNDVDAFIVGVAPPTFFGPTVGQWTDLYAPLASRAALDRSRGADSTENPANWWVQQIAVLSSDLSVTQALIQLNAAFRGQIAALADAMPSASVPELVAADGRRGISPPMSEIRTALWLLMLLVGLLLVMVCVNVANLLLARSEGRLHESVVRLTLGATPSRIFRQQLTESALLALGGACGGLALGQVFAVLIHDLFQVGRDASNVFSLDLDTRIVSYGIGLSMAAALMFGLSPALRAAGAWLGGNLRPNGRSVVAATLRGPKLLVTAQIAMCLGALVAAGLLGRSLQALTEIDLGFDPERLVYATVNPSLSDFPTERVEGYLDDVQRSLEALPGVESVSRLSVRPLEGGGNFSPVNIPGNPREQEFDPRFVVSMNAAGPEVFETLGIPLLAGRGLDASGNGVVVDERFVERYFDGREGLGLRFGTGAPGNDDQFEIIGIARNSISLQLRRDPLPTVYVPHQATPFDPAVNFAIRTSQDPRSVFESIRSAVSAVNASVPLTDLRTQTELLERMLRTERMLAFLSTGFSLMATVLAAIGLAGLLAYVVARRRSEIGLRMALGAAPGQMVTMVMKDSLRLVAAGVVLGIPLALAIAKLLQSSLYELAPSDPATMGIAIAALVSISGAAAFVPALRAAKTAPGAALRDE